MAGVVDVVGARAWYSININRPSGGTNESSFLSAHLRKLSPIGSGRDPDGLVEQHTVRRDEIMALI